MASAVLSQSQFGRVAPKKKDPSGDPKFNRVRFSGSAGGSKTMHIAKGAVPKPPGEHPHHRKAGKRTRRAR
jgi:hypothetical protein